MGGDRWQDAVAARLERVSETESLAPVLEPMALVEARELTALILDDERDLDARFLLGWLHWYRYHALPKGQDHDDQLAMVEMFLPCFIGGTDLELLPEQLVPYLAYRAVPHAEELLLRAAASSDLHLITTAAELWRRIADHAERDPADCSSALQNLAALLQMKFLRTGLAADLDEAIRVGREAVAATPADDPDRGARLSNLGGSLRTSFERTGALADLDEAIRVGREAVDLTPAGGPERAAALTNLSTTLRAGFVQVGLVAGLDEAVGLGREAVSLTPAGEPGRAVRLANLGAVLLARYDVAGVLDDLGEAIRVSREAAAGTPAGSPERPGVLLNLGNMLRARFERTGSLADLDEAVATLDDAVESAPTTHPERGFIMAGLGGALHRRFQQGGVEGDLDRAVANLRKAVNGTAFDHVGRADLLTSLTTVLQTKYEMTGRQDDLDEAVRIGREAVEDFPAGSPNRAVILATLGNVLTGRFERIGVQEDLDEAIAVLQEAAACAPTGDPRRAAVVTSLGNALRHRADRTGSQEDRNAASARFHEAVDAADDDQVDRVSALVNLSNVLTNRFESTGDLTDLNEGIRLLRKAVAATSADQPDWPRVQSNLAGALQHRFTRTGDKADLDEAIRVGRQAVEATPADHSERPGRLTNLGLALQARYLEDRESADLDEAISRLAEVVSLVHPDHPERPSFLTNLGGSLYSRFVRSESLRDLDEAIRADREAVDTIGATHPLRPKLLSNLAVDLRARFVMSEEPADLAAALARYEEVAGDELAAPSVRIRAARSAGELAADTEPGRAAALLELAVRLLPQVAPRQLGRNDQQFALGGFADLAADAAALALNDPATPKDQRPALALRLLEAGRAVLLSRALEAHSDLTDLMNSHRALADRFVDLRNQLDQPSAELAGDGGTAAVEAVGRERRRLATAWTDLLAEIREQEGFKTFAEPPETEDLLAQAAERSVVVFNLSEYRSDALLLTADGIDCLPLPHLSLVMARGMATVFHLAVADATRARTIPERVAAQEQLNLPLRGLWEFAARPVLDALGYTGAPAPGQEWPRVWWVPGGVLGMLPVHAAGYHDDPSDPAARAVLDRVVSSYIPTVGALRHARRDPEPASPDTAGRALIVAMPTTPGGPRPLGHVCDEADRLAARLPGSTVLVEPEPTRSNVLSLLATFPIAHFACHGVNDPGDPSQSRLLLHDHEDAPLTVAALAPVRLRHARLAYLSACESALTTDTKLVDEAIHLASAFQLAGYRHVIGTLWAIDDSWAVRIADDFYAGLVTDRVPDTDRAAHALHHAVRAVRHTLRATPSLWAAHLHVGA
ncbi:CHAT domain-containing protein [Streptomyces sp. SAS_267]|uniref:CHAT domain-containing protein n=1 Tax=Streptomyces sp. SAS_267 TaxID=3412750 RepID=UPI00403D1BA6